MRSYPKKLTTRDMGLRTEVLEKFAAENAKDGPKTVARIYGKIEKAESGTGTYGEYQKFFGEFEGVNTIDDSQARSRVLCVPAVAEVVLLEMVDNADGPVTFGIDLTVEYYENKNGTQFRFGVRPLVEPKAEDDFLTQLGNELASGKLAAPKGKGAKK